MRQTYVTHAAFGNSESCGWPADALKVLSQAAEDMTSRLRRGETRLKGFNNEISSEVTWI